MSVFVTVESEVSIHQVAKAAVQIAESCEIERLASYYAKEFERAAVIIRDRMTKSRQWKGDRQVKAWEDWLATPIGQQCVAGEASGAYLENRIWRAFIAGYEYAEQIRKGR
jgi:stress response protein SCP2